MKKILGYKKINVKGVIIDVFLEKIEYKRGYKQIRAFAKISDKNPIKWRERFE